MKIDHYSDSFENNYKNILSKESTNFKEIIDNIRLFHHSFCLDPSKFYYSKPTIKIYTENKYLKGIIESNNIQQLYLSYHTLNNQFNVAPEYSLLDLSQYSCYKFYLQIEADKNLTITPYIIHYKDKKKLKLTPIKNYGQSIDFKNNDQCRLTFKMVGSGTFRIKNISIIAEG